MMSVYESREGCSVGTDLVLFKASELPAYDVNVGSAPVG